MPFYSGKGSGVVFTSETRPGTVLTLFADEWGIEIGDESVPITNIKMFRDKNIVDDLSPVPAWKNFGVPTEILNGGMRDTKLTIHGFLFLDDTISVNDGARVPIIDEKGKIELKYEDQNGRKKNLFVAESVVVINTSFDLNVKGIVEYDMEFHCLSNVVDYTPHPKV